MTDKNKFEISESNSFYKILKFFLKNHAFFIIGVILITQILTYSILREDSYLEIHDNLDSIMVWLKSMKDNQVYFSQGAYIPILNDMSRDYFPSEFQLSNILFYFMPLFYAYITLYFVKVLVGTFSFNLLCKFILKKKYEENKNLILLVSFAFSLLPGYANLYLAQVTIPLIFYLLMKSYQKIDYKILAALFFYPVLSEFSRYGIFILGLLILSIIFISIHEKKINRNLIISFFILMTGYIVVEYRLFYLMIFSDTQTLRDTFVLSTGNIVKNFKINFKNGQYHAQSIHEKVIYPLCIAFLLLKNLTYIKNLEFKKIFKDKYNLLILFIAFNSYVYALYYGSSEIRNIVAYILPPLKGWNFGRLLWFNPFLWYLLFLLILICIKESFKKLNFVASLVVLYQIFIIITSSTYGNDFINTLIYTSNSNNKLTYREFFSEDLFETIKEDINYSEEKSISYGFHPAILSYNNIATLDGYNNFYPLEYKSQFRKIVAPTLDKSERWRKYFDNWGARAYIFPEGDYSYAPSKRTRKTANLNINTNEFKNLKGKYIFSRSEILNYSENNLKFLKKYTNKTSPYNIYLYQVKQS